MRRVAPRTLSGPVALPSLDAETTSRAAEDPDREERYAARS
jgi:hypothetical protein